VTDPGPEKLNDLRMTLRAEDAERTRSSFIDRIGIYPPLVWGYVGLLLFMIGDGVESGFLSPYLVERGWSQERVAMVFTAYGLTAALAAWLSGALSDLWGPRRVMAAGLAIWVVFEVAFLLFGVAPNRFPLILVFYALRGFGYPLFAFGFLVWITAVTPARRLGTAVGWFWFGFTGGLPTLGSLFASYTVPRVGPYITLWLSLGLVVAGGVVALAGVREPIGRRRLVAEDENPIATLLAGVTIAWREPKIAIGCIVRVINTAPEFGFLVFLPIFFTETVGFSLPQWLRLLSLIFLSNIIWNLLFGVIGDRFGWRRTVALCGGLGSAISTLLLYYTPHLFGASFPLAALAGILYGATLAGYVPLSALMPSLTPAHRGAAMSMLNLGAGASVWVGPALVALFLPRIEVVGVMWLFAILYLISGILALFLTLPAEDSVPATPAEP
jgi:polyol permease family